MSREEGSSLPRNVDLCVDECDTDTSVRPQDALILQEIAEERIRQEDKWGEQNHLDGTGVEWTRYVSPWVWREDRAAQIADLAKSHCERKARIESLTFMDIALEEIAEAFAETDEQALRAELVQCAAVLVAWIGAIDRRKTGDEQAAA